MQMMTLPTPRVPICCLVSPEGVAERQREQQVAGELALNHDLCLQRGATGVLERNHAKPAVPSVAVCRLDVYYSGLMRGDAA